MALCLGDEVLVPVKVIRWLRTPVEMDGLRQFDCSARSTIDPIGAMPKTASSSSNPVHDGPRAGTTCQTGLRPGRCPPILGRWATCRLVAPLAVRRTKFSDGIAHGTFAIE